MGPYTYRGEDQKPAVLVPWAQRLEAISSGAIVANDIVIVTGESSGHPLVAVASSAAASTTHGQLYVATGGVATGEKLTIVPWMRIIDVDTDAAAAAGDPVYLSTGGDWSLTAGTVIREIGVVMVDSATVGEVLLRPSVFNGTVDFVDLNGGADALVLDADGDTTISAPTDDQIDIEIAGADDFTFTANSFNALAGSKFFSPDLILDSTNEINVQIGGAGLLAIDDAAISGNTAPNDAVGQDCFIETQDAGASATSANAGGLLSLKTGDGSAGVTTVNAGGAGGAITETTGTGGIGGTTQDGGAGGAASYVAGAGGINSLGAADSGAGGAVNVTTGAGAAQTFAGASGSGGAGGTLAFTAGVGGATADTGSNAGGAGGGATLATGVGGVVSAGTGIGGQGGDYVKTIGDGGLNSGAQASGAGGQGGSYQVTAGAGGSTNNTGTDSGGAGGTANVIAGAGGAASGAGVSEGGVGGNVSITAGAAGAASGGGSAVAAGGSVILTSGAGDASGVAGAIRSVGLEVGVQGAATVETAAATLTAAKLLTGIVEGTQSTGSDNALTLDTGTNMTSGTPLANGDYFDWVVINLSAAAADTYTVTASADHTVVGMMTVASIHSTTGGLTGGSSGRFRSRLVTGNTWITYRIG